MSKKRVLLVDCDGVISPLSAVPIKSLISSVQIIAKKWLFSDSQYKEANKDLHGKGNGELGLFNGIYKLVGKDMQKYEDFCKDVFDIMDYSKLKLNTKLYSLLEEASLYYDIYIATNNHRTHVKNVVLNVFGKNIDKDEVCFKVIDITMTLRDGYFHPKQSTDGLSIYASLANSPPENCILIDDSYHNIELAESIHMESYLISNYYSVNQCLMEMISNAKKTQK